MKITDKCPFCNSIFQQEYHNDIAYTLKCITIHHSIEFIIRNNELRMMKLFNINKLPKWDRATFFFEIKTIRLWKNEMVYVNNLPWFNPDFTSIAKNINRINMILAFQ